LEEVVAARDKLATRDKRGNVDSSDTLDVVGKKCIMVEEGHWH